MSKRVVLITGASRGIGRAIAQNLAAPDTMLYLNCRTNRSLADELAKELKGRDCEARVLPFDISNTEEVAAAFEKIAKDEGGLDVLINNAGIARDGLVLRTKDEDWQAVMDTNLKGAFACTRAALKTMLRRKGERRIVFLSSVVGQMGNAGQTVYATTKAGLLGMTKSIAREVASRGITVNAIAPGFVRTEMTDSLTDSQKEDLLKAVPLQRWAEPEEIASVIRFLISKEAAYITGQVIGVNGGMYL